MKRPHLPTALLRASLSGSFAFALTLSSAFAEPAAAPETTEATQAADSGSTDAAKQAPNFVLTDTQGKEHSLSDFSGKTVVLEWVNYSCPFVAAQYKSGQIPQAQAQSKEDGVVWLSINSSAPGKQGHHEPEKLEQIAKDHGWQGSAILLDGEGTVGWLYEAKTTPHVYVIDPEGQLVYEGAWDDNVTTNAEEAGGTQYVLEAIAAIKAGKEPAVSATEPYGCSVKYAD